jgi:4-hydroxybenzoate polyprenyltransferase
VRRSDAADAEGRTVPSGLKKAAQASAWAVGCLVAVVVVAFGLLLLFWWAAWHGM